MTGKEKKFLRQYATCLRFVQKKHRGQFRAGRVPVWHHLAHVSQALRFFLEKHKEGEPDERFAIILAGLGHDILEDTDAAPEEIKKIFGKRGAVLVSGMTNTWGDKNTAPYVRKIIRSEEAVRLIKLADLYDNLTSAVYNFKLLGKPWMKSFFLPIVMPMQAAVTKTKFPLYPKTAAKLIALTDAGMNLLAWEMENN